MSDFRQSDNKLKLESTILYYSILLSERVMQSFILKYFNFKISFSKIASPLLEDMQREYSFITLKAKSVQATQRPAVPREMWLEFVFSLSVLITALSS